MRPTRPLAGLAAAALLAFAVGCGDDETGQETTADQVSIPSPTSPIAPGTTTGPAQSGPVKKEGTRTQATGGTSATCEVPATYQDFQFSGLDCAAALAVAEAWDANGKQCNTIDNPDSPEGYNRTCSVDGYTCDAKRDVNSDGRFVTCTQGGTSVRFTWFPA